MGGDADGSDRRNVLQRMALRRLRREAGKQGGEPLSEEDWGAFWAMDHSHSGRFLQAFWLALPGRQRCGVCGAPFAGPGSLVTRPLGYRPSRKNPTICATCVESSPPGGMTMPTGVLFADLRGFTSVSESADPRSVSEMLRRFYGCAEQSLFPEAVIDKLIGDEVMALYLAPLSSPLSPADVPALMVEQAASLLSSVGYGSEEGPFAELGIGIDFGDAYVGNIGSRAVYDFTAVGDVVNTASRLQGQAAGGEIVFSERVAERLPTPVGTRVDLRLKGKADPECAYRLRV